MTSGRATPFEHRRVPVEAAPGRPDCLDAWGLKPAFGDGSPFGARDLADGRLALEWTALDRTGILQRVRIDVDARSGCVAPQRPFAHWSEVPTPRSHVIVVPDILTFVAIAHALRGESMAPFVLVAQVGGAPPDTWFDRSYWEFEKVTLTSDGLFRPSRLIRHLAERDVAHVGVAVPPGGGTWRDWANGRGRLHYDALVEIESSALPISAFADTPAHGRDGLERLRRRCRGLDEAGRLCRVLDIEACGDAPAQARLVRSDRTSAVVPRQAGSTDPDVARWRTPSLAAFLDDGLAPSDVDAGQALREMVSPLVGGDPRAARMLTSFVALTYVHQACLELPVVMVRGGGMGARLALRRLLAQLCCAPVVVSRMRAHQLARVLDAGDGTLLLDEPGPLCGPRGPTEIGRLVVDGTLRGASTFTRVSDRHGLRTLDVFGPKLVLAAGGSAAGLSGVFETVDMPTEAVEGPVVATGLVEDVRDALHAWAMTFHVRLRGVPADRILPTIAEALHGSGIAPPAMSAPDEPRPAAEPEVSPADEMEDAFGAVGSAGHVALIQVMLEIAARRRDPDTFSPERVGRWIAAHSRVDRDAPVERRRLHGQISRIYRLTGAADDAEATSAFAFCLERVCGDCRYGTVCGTVYPDLHRRKRAI